MHAPKTLLFLAGLFFFSHCNKKEEVNPEFFKAFSTGPTFTEVLKHPHKKWFYTIEAVSFGGKIRLYDYENFELIHEAINPSNFWGYGFAIGEFNGEVELYVEAEQEVHIYNAENLQLKDKITIFEEGDPRLVISVGFQEPDLIFVSADDQSSGASSKGSRAYSRTTKQFLSNAYTGRHYLRIRTYVDDPTTGTIGVLGVNSRSSKSILISDKYDSEGNFLEALHEIPLGGSGVQLLKTNDKIDYFVSGYFGGVYRKDSLTYLGDLPKVNFPKTEYRDVIFTEQGDIMYAITNQQSVIKVAYPSLETLATIPLEINAFFGFIDENKLLIFYSTAFSAEGNLMVSILDI